MRPWPHWKDQHRAHAVFRGVRRDVIAVARTGEASVAQVAWDFGILDSCLAAGSKGPTKMAACPSQPAATAAAEAPCGRGTAGRLH